MRLSDCDRGGGTYHDPELLGLGQLLVLGLELGELRHLLGLRHVLDELLDDLRRQLLLVHLDDAPLQLVVRNLDGAEQDRCDKTRSCE